MQVIQEMNCRKEYESIPEGKTGQRMERRKLIEKLTGSGHSVF
jgi:hypothetical protein